MYFSEFAQRLGRVLIEDSNTSIFVRTLFLEIIPEDRYYLMEKISKSTFKSYYNGHFRINSLARKIVACVNVKLFERFIKRSGKSAVSKLCEIFSDVWEDIDSNNAGEKIARLFDDIITEAAAMNKRQSGKSKETADFAESRNYKIETEEGMKEAMTGEWVYSSGGTKSDGKNRNENENENKAENVRYIQFAQKITNNNLGDIHGNLTLHMD